MLGERNRLVRVVFGVMLVCFLTAYLAGCKEGRSDVPIGAVFDETSQVLQTTSGATGTFSLRGTVKSKGTSSLLGNISVSLKYNGSLLMTTRTTSEGLFSFAGLGANLYDITVEDNSKQFSSATYIIQIFEDGTTSPATPEIVMAETIAADPTKAKFPISGTLLTDDATAKEIGNEVVRLLSSSSVVVKVTSSAVNGKFEFKDIPPGDYILQAGYGSSLYKQKDIAPVTLNGDGVVIPPLTVLLSRIDKAITGTIIGVVYLSSSKEPANLLEVTLDKGGSVSTTANGRFYFPDLAPGFYTVTIDPNQKRFATQKIGIQILTDGKVVPELAEVYVSPLPSKARAFTATGTITDAFSGSPLEYVTCTVRGINSTLSDKSGNFFFSNLATGSYFLEFKKLGYNDLVVNFSIDDLGMFPEKLNYSMIYNQEGSKASIAGRYTDPDTQKAPTGNLWIQLYEYEQMTKTAYLPLRDVNGNITGYQLVSETDWELDPTPIRFTDFNSVASDFYNQEGSFKFTHLDPTKKFHVYIGNYGSSLATKTSTLRYFDWTREDINNASRTFSWDLIPVESNVTTFITNYEPNK